MGILNSFNNVYKHSEAFPLQRIPNNKKDKVWAAQCIDYIIKKGNDEKRIEELENKYNILNGNIPNEFYKKTLNPYNATKEKYKKFPATMRNYDLIKGIVRRYVSEYIKNPHDFMVSANNPEVVLAKNYELKKELMKLAEAKIASKIIESYQQFLNNGGEPEQFNPKEHIDVEAFIKKFNEDYIDDISAQGQEILNVIKDITNDTLFYARAYFDFVSFGECYTYSEIQGTELIKRNIAPIDAFPINDDNMFIEDMEMFACKRKLTYQQIIDEFGKYFNEKELKFLNDYYNYTNKGIIADLKFSTYYGYFPDVCDKYFKEDRDLFKNDNIMIRDTNNGLYDVWHVVWRGEIRKAIVSYVNEAGLIDKRIEDDNYKLNVEIGDIDIEYIYEPQVYEGVRIGGKYDALYPYNARPIFYNRKGKLPYNGINELLPGFGKFSIVEIVTPYQVFYNIVAYHREMVIAKNKLAVLVIAKSLLGSNPEDTIYKMIADNVLYIDDTNDSGMLRAQQIRTINMSLGDYINQLSNLLHEIEQAAKNQVDMTPQRYGEIANSAGKGVTDEAIMRGSMGSVIIEYMVDCLRETDYARDMDFTKWAWIDGLDTSYRDDNNNIKYLTLDTNKHSYADYLIKAKNSIKEKEKFQQLQNIAFNASQNGDFEIALASVMGDNISAINKLIKKFLDEKRNHELELKQLDEQTAQANKEFELQKIQLKGEEDRKTKELEGIIDKEIEMIKANANIVSYNNEVSNVIKQNSIDKLNSIQNNIKQEQLKIAREKNLLDIFNKQKDRDLKEKDINAKIQIAKENKNKYDFKNK